MFYVPIIIGSVRRGRKSPRVATFIEKRLTQTGQVQTELLDLLEYNFPIMEERLRFRDDPPARLQEFADKINRADGIVIVTPEYNYSYPASLKNALDYLLPEFKHKPVGLITASGGPFGGLNALYALLPIMLALGTIVTPLRFPIPFVDKNFDEDGTPHDPQFDKTAEKFIAEFLWLTEAVSARKNKDTAVPQPK